MQATNQDDGGAGWARDFYDHTRERWGPSGILPHHRERAAQVARLCGPGKKRVLELGCGAGGAAAALAELGHDVVALDLSPVSVAFAKELAAQQNHNGSLIVHEADFYTVALEGRFDVVACWDSFGVGSDVAQRRLLRRVAAEWLAPGGVALFDVFHPARWLRATGQRDRIETDQRGVFVRERDFDPIGGRFIDRWWPEGEEACAEAQSIRCYTPADLLLLLEGVGLTVTHAEANGTPFSVTGDGVVNAPLGEAWSYLVRLTPIAV